MNNLIGLVVSFAFIVLIMGLATLFGKLGWLKDEGTRKFIHIGVGNWWIIAMIFFDSVWFAIIMPIVFIVLNYLSYRFQLVKAMERSEGNNLGTVYYPISLLVLVVFTFGVINQPFIGLIGVLTMAYADGLAAVIGKKYNTKKIYQQKSLAGTITMYVVTFLSVLIVSLIYIKEISPSSMILIILIVPIIATIVELYSKKGLDNIFVPIATTLIAYVLILL